MQHVWNYLVLGLTAGAATALTSVGLVTVYRGSGVLNLAFGAFGMAGTYVFHELWYDLSLPTPVAVVAGLAASTVLGLAFYWLVMRRLSGATELAKTIATLGALLLLTSVATLLYGSVPELVEPFLGQGSFTVFGAALRKDTVGVIVAVVVLAIGLSLLFSRTRLGLAATALRERPPAAQAVGISPHPTGLLTWGIGGALAGFAGIFLLPVTGLSPGQLTAVVFTALAACLLGRFRSYPVTVAASFVIGIGQSILQSYAVNQGVVQSLPFALIILALVWGGTTIPGRGATDSRLPRVTPRGLRPRSVVAVVGVIGLVMVALDSGWAVALTSTAVVGLIGLSMVVVTGFTGQLSLAAFATAGVVSLAVVRLGQALHLPFVLDLPVGVVVGAAIGLVTGLPAIRVRGIDLAVVTLGVALILEFAVLSQPTLVGSFTGLPVDPPSLLGWDISPTTHPQRYGLVALAVLGLSVLAVNSLRGSRGGRRLLATRANERGATSLGISVVGAKLAGFALAGGLIGLAAVIATFRLPVATFDNFDFMKSVVTLTFSVVGSIGYVGGGVFAGLAAPGGVIAGLFRDVPEFANWAGIVGGLSVMLVLLTNQDGETARLAALGRTLRRGRTTTVDAGRRPATGPPSAPATAVTTRRSAGRPAEHPVLEIRDVTVTYGGVTAVDGVDLHLRTGRILGVIGPNGAGKTSLIDAVHGFTRIARGAVVLNGVDVSRRTPLARARAGLTRTFQNLELFDGLTVRENLLAATDARDTLAYLTGLVRPQLALTEPHLLEVVELLGLTELLDRLVEDLPNGTRRLVAVARAIGTAPAVICLDEPTAGLSGGERAEAVATLRRLVDGIDVAVLLVEHNLDVVEALCDDLVALSFGRVVAAGSPQDVLRDPAVVAAYLGRSAEPATDGASVRPLMEGTVG